MAIGLFLDVDNTLTHGFIQRYYAVKLGCAPEYDAIEDAFKENAIDSDTFGEQLIALFAAHDFTKAVADEAYADVLIHTWVEGLFTLPVRHYLVSSGPSYFIQRFADDHGMSKDHVLCSMYHFDGPGGRISSCAAVDEQMKAEFVRRRASLYDMAIGVGDSAEKDGPFLSGCTLPILLGSDGADASFARVKNFNALYGLLQRVTGVRPLTRGTWSTTAKPRCFVGSSSEDRKVARALAAEINDFCTVSLWEYAFPAGRTTIESLESELERCELAVLVVEPNDVTTSRGVEWGAPRDNVVFELGLFMGALGRECVFLLCPAGLEIKIPSDLSGVTRLSYTPAPDEPDPRGSLVDAVETIRRVVDAG